ncbi:MAG: YraN family protein [Desulfovibrionaceae bacterium]|nr:YraN family protein [Desulfovibrionaceae bacterium]MBF0512787.1 YraN family protein [Desulfovibrionaceae bacterium]
MPATPSDLQGRSRGAESGAAEGRGTGVPARHLIRGERGEAAAEAELLRRGYAVVERNWRCRGGEIDLVCRQGATLVFVEVKTRDARGRQMPVEALSPTKKSRLLTAASRYLSEKNLWDRPCRFDLAAVTADGEGMSVRVERDVIQAASAAAGAWQPW